MTPVMPSAGCSWMSPHQALGMDLLRHRHPTDDVLLSQTLMLDKLRFPSLLPSTVSSKSPGLPAFKLQIQPCHVAPRHLLAP